MPDANDSNFYDIITGAWRNSRHWVAHSIPRLLVAAFVLLLTWWVARVADRVARRLMGAVTADQRLAGAAGVAARVLVAVLGIAMALNLLELPQAAEAVLAAMAVIGLALALGAQDLAANYVSGLSLTVNPPFSAGDYVEVGEVQGTVERMGLRYTVLLTVDGARVLLPNRELLRQRLVNRTALGKRRIDVEIVIAPTQPTEPVRRLAQTVLADLPWRDAARDVEVRFEKWTSQGLRMRACIWIDFQRAVDAVEARAAAMESLVEAFRREGIATVPPLNERKEKEA